MGNVGSEDAMQETRAGMTRREVLRAGLSLAAGTVLARIGLATQQPQKEKRRMVHIGIQSYCLRDLPWQQAMERAKALGVNAWEVFPGHIPTTLDENADKARSTLAAAKMAMPNYGVIALGDDPEADRKQFEFAKRMGISVLTADPNPAQMQRVSALVQEFGIAVAIHNHGPKARYDRVEDVERVLAGTPAKIGACVDTGHFIRSGEDPVAALRAFGKKVLAIHLKDYLDVDTETVLGEGKLDVDATMRAVKEIGFEGLIAVEYEPDPKGEGDALKRCLEIARASARKAGLIE
ncbi:MAG: hypothetical protein AMXMBFR61_18760 [Fimbriimonadales bacterium]